MPFSQTSEQGTGSNKASGKSTTIAFDGQIFRHPVQTDDSIIELVTGSKVYISKDDLEKAKSDAIKATEFVRALLQYVFTTEAMLHCSLKGRPSYVQGVGAVVRQPLDPHAVDTIISAAKSRQDKKKWRPAQNDETIKKAMRQKLQDVRDADRKKGGGTKQSQ